MTINGMDAFSWRNLCDKEREEFRKKHFGEGEYWKVLSIYDAREDKAVILLQDMGYKFKDGEWVLAEEH